MTATRAQIIAAGYSNTPAAGSRLIIWCHLETNRHILWDSETLKVHECPNLLDSWQSILFLLEISQFISELIPATAGITSQRRTALLTRIQEGSLKLGAETNL